MNADERKRVSRQLGLKVKHFRGTQGVSQEELAFRIGIDRTYLSGIERGQRNPTLTVLCRIAHGLGIPVANLLQGVDARATKAKF